ncbi:MAG: hypothetical protein LBN05_02665 [Oscillospiraceae bacterium]|jgi:peptidoglycan glycosyltransferase|nr:hypothetical protein [Oscillospiraceae bacterium]
MDSKTLKNRFKWVFGVAALLFVLLGIWLMLGPTARMGGQVTAAATVAHYKQSQNKRGSFLDAQMQPIALPSRVGTQNRSYPDEEAAKAYGSVLGYSTDMYGHFGLEGLYNEVLLTPADDKSTDGQNVQLTLNTTLQKAVAAQIGGYKEGAAGLVMNAKTGEMLACVSAPLLDLARFDEQYETNSKMDALFLNKALLTYVPGSVMKLVTSGAILNAGLENEQYYDSGRETVPGYSRPLHNYAGWSFGKISLVGGLGNSVNTYFAHQAMNEKIGAAGLEKIQEKYLFNQKIALDFGNMEASTTNMRTEDGREDLFQVAQTAFGQGDVTRMSPVHVAMITATLANGGDTPKPYMVQRIVPPDTKKLPAATKPTWLAKNVLRKSDCAFIREGMLVSANGTFGKEYVAETGVRSKTGTAEVQTNGVQLVNQWLTVIAPVNGEDYIITLMVLDQPLANSGRLLGDPVKAIRKILNEVTK